MGILIEWEGCFDRLLLQPWVFTSDSVHQLSALRSFINAKDRVPPSTLGDFPVQSFV